MIYLAMLKQYATFIKFGGLALLVVAILGYWWSLKAEITDLQTQIKDDKATFDVFKAQATNRENQLKQIIDSQNASTTLAGAKFDGLVSKVDAIVANTKVLVAQRNKLYAYQQQDIENLHIPADCNAALGFFITYSNLNKWDIK